MKEYFVYSSLMRSSEISIMFRYFGANLYFSGGFVLKCSFIAWIVLPLMDNSVAIKHTYTYLNFGMSY